MFVINQIKNKFTSIRYIASRFMRYSIYAVFDTVNLIKIKSLLEIFFKHIALHIYNIVNNIRKFELVH